MADLEQGSVGGSEKQSDDGYIWKMESVGFAHELVVGHERERSQR